MKYPNVIVSVALAFLIGVGATNVIAQEEIGGPYEPDSSTVLLLHFNGDFVNESDSSGDAMRHGNVAFVSQSPIAGGGQSIYLDNDSPSDSSFIAVADTPALDLTGSWTIEAWVNIFTYGETNDDHRWSPRLLIKPGDDPPYFNNFTVYMVGANRSILTGYYTPSGDDWVEFTSQGGLMQAGEWLHITFIRDTTEHIIAQLVHDQEMNQLFFGSMEYDPITGAPPLPSDQPVYIGTNPGLSSPWFDGFIEEFRISNTVRNFALPPIIKSVSNLSNQSAEASSYPIEAEIFKIGPGDVSNATLHYTTDGSNWQTQEMTAQGERQYATNISSQSRGTRVQYYVSAEDEFGAKATSPPTAELDSVYYEFAIWKPQSQTLALTFEEGSETPADTTLYGHAVEMVGNPQYSEDAIVGDYSMKFEGDSSYLEIDSPFLASEQFTVDFWFKSDSLQPDGTRMVAKQGGGSWFQVNYQIRFGAGGFIVPASYIPSSGAYIGSDLADSTAITEVGKWYRILYEVGEDYAAYELRDSSDTAISSNRIPLDGPPAVTTGVFRVAHADGPANPYFNGKIDNLNIYNYVHDSVATGIEDWPNRALPDRLVLEQNYPNPFNPTTTIGFRLPSRQEVQVTVYDLMGRQVKTLANDLYSAGEHSVKWHGINSAGQQVASGVYFYRIRTPEEVRVRKMVLLR